MFVIDYNILCILYHNWLDKCWFNMKMYNRKEKIENRKNLHLYRVLIANYKMYTEETQTTWKLRWWRNIETTDGDVVEIVLKLFLNEMNRKTFYINCFMINQIICNHMNVSYIRWAVDWFVFNTKENRMDNKDWYNSWGIIKSTPKCVLKVIKQNKFD